MSDWLDARKRIVITEHLARRWGQRIIRDASLKSLVDKSNIIKDLQETITGRKYRLLYDGEEYNGTKYRLVCRLQSQLYTFSVIDAGANIFKSVWPSKDWERKLFEGESK